MQKQLKSKLEKIEKDQLIEIIETFCNVKENEQLLKVLLIPSKSGVDGLVRNFSRCAEAFIGTSCSNRAYDKMIAAMEPIYAALKNADSRLSAYIIFEIYQVARENDLFEFDCADFVYELLEDLRYILDNEGDLFSNEERIRYQCVIEEEN